MGRQIDPSKIMDIGFGFWASKILLTAVKLDLFTELNVKALSAEEIRRKLALHERSIYDFLDALVSLGFLSREAILDSAYYSNTEETKTFLNKKSPHYIGGILEMANDRLYRFWGDLEEGLKTGKPQNEIKYTGKTGFEAIYAEPERLRQFIHAMSGIQMGNFIAFATKFDFSKYNTLCDVGGAGGHLSIQVALNNEHMKCTTLDLPQVEPIAKEIVEQHGLSLRISAISRDFFKDEIPEADIITMGMILHDWNLEQKKNLIQKAYNALPEGGAFAAIECIIDNERKNNSLGLMTSLNMLIESEGGFDFTGADFDTWCKEVGFKKTEVMPLAAYSAAIAFK